MRTRRTADGVSAIWVPAVLGTLGVALILGSFMACNGSERDPVAGPSPESFLVGQEWLVFEVMVELVLECDEGTSRWLSREDSRNGNVPKRSRS